MIEDFYMDYLVKIRGAGSMPDDDELVMNPPTPCQIGKHPPAPKIRPTNKGHMVEGVGGQSEGAGSPPEAEVAVTVLMPAV